MLRRGQSTPQCAGSVAQDLIVSIDALPPTPNGELQTAPEGFQRRHRPRDFFKFGKVRAAYAAIRTMSLLTLPFQVFEIYWPENIGLVLPAPSHVSTIANSRFGDIYVKCRKFVVIATPEGDNHCVCVSVVPHCPHISFQNINIASHRPIYTYSGHGVSRSGRPKWTHSIIYTGRQAPEPLDDEKPQNGEAGLLAPPIKVNPANPSIALDPLSRVNFSKIQSVDHACHVRAIGNVINERDLGAHSRFVWARMQNRN